MYDNDVTNNLYVSNKNGYGSLVRRVICPKGHFVRNVVVQIPKFEAKPNPKPNPNPMSIFFGQMTLRTSELLP